MASKSCRSCGGTGNRPVFGSHPWVVDAVYPCHCKTEQRKVMTTINRFAWKEGGKWVHSFLSNFSESYFQFDGLTWPTLEHAYQAAKTDDPDERLAINQAPTPGEAKNLGQKVTLRPGWDNVKDDVMLRLLRIKFGQNRDLRDQLVATGHGVLIEGNTWHDNHFGVCTCGRPACKEPPGKNMLGILLMKVRDEINGEVVSGITKSWNGEGHHTLTYTLTVTSYGHEEKVLREVQNTLDQMLEQTFDDRFTLKFESVDPA